MTLTVFGQKHIGQSHPGIARIVFGILHIEAVIALRPLSKGIAEHSRTWSHSFCNLSHLVHLRKRVKTSKVVGSQKRAIGHHPLVVNVIKQIYGRIHLCSKHIRTHIRGNCKIFVHRAAIESVDSHNLTVMGRSAADHHLSETGRND